ncbi:MAG: radical SAM protein, partial [Deltaproteobacteria bacterium]|nr:radical SAM protein [Deltaproteobacteria bacterium]
MSLIPGTIGCAVDQPGKMPDWCEITLTHRCNQRCFFCYEEGRDIAREPDLANVKRLLDEVSKKAEQVTLCGKEILLRKDILEIVRYASGIGLRVTVFTNGQAFERRELAGELVEAGCTGAVISFHFPDAETFARGARVSSKCFHKTIKGLKNIRDYNLANPEKRLHINTETDMFALNAGRLAGMRDILIEALGGGGWKMRIGALLPSPVYDIGLGHVLEPVSDRRAELAEFIESHPDGVPLEFVKIPLCLLPPDKAHLSLDVRYMYEGTRLTLNHADPEKITVDDISTSFSRDIGGKMRAHPYRWVCRMCNLAPVCRFERVDWNFRYFEPTREQKPFPFTDLTAGGLFARLGNEKKNLRVVNGIVRFKRKSPFPEEELISALTLKGGGGARLTGVWIDREPLFTAEFKINGHSIPLLFRPPEKKAGSVRIGAIIKYFHVEPAGGAVELPPGILSGLLRAINRRRFPDIGKWGGEKWFDMSAGMLFQAASRIFGSRIWPGIGRFGCWLTDSARLEPSGELVFEAVHPSLARAELIRRTDRPVFLLSLVKGAGAEKLTRKEFVMLLKSVFGRLSVGEFRLPDVPYEDVINGTACAAFDEGRLFFGQTRELKTCATQGDLILSVRDLRDMDSGLTFHISRYREGLPHFKRVGNLILWYSNGELTGQFETF